MLCPLLVSLLMLSPTLAMPDEKIDEKLLLGKWEPEKKPDNADKVTVEYKEGGKMTVEVEAQGMTLKFEGEYKVVDGNKLEIKVDFNGKEQNQKRKITKLTKDEMVTNDEKMEERKYKKVK